MVRRKHPTVPDDPTGDPDGALERADNRDHGHHLAPVVTDPDAPTPARVTASDLAAPVFPTEADEAEAIAEVLAKDPHLTTHAFHRAIREQLARNATRAAKRQRVLATTIADERAPVFPTEAHAGDLVDAIPTISEAELKGVFAAGYSAYLASLDQREPVLVAPDQE